MMNLFLSSWHCSVFYRYKNTTFGRLFDTVLRYCLNQAVRGSSFVLWCGGKPKGVKWNKIITEKNCCCVAYGILETAAQSSKLNASKRLSTKYWLIFVYVMPRPNYAGEIWKDSLISKIRPFTPIRHENRAFRKLSLNQRNFKTPVFALY